MEQTEKGETKIIKKKKPVKSKREIVIEEVEDEIERKVVTKKITARKPEMVEEYNELEDTKVLKPFETKTQKEIPLETHSYISEAIPTLQVTQTLTEKIPADNVNINVIPHTAISQEEILPQDKESDSDKSTLFAVTAKAAIDTLEAYQVKEEDVQNAPKTFDDQFKPTTSKATTEIVSSQSIDVREVQEGHTVSDISKEKAVEDNASMILILQEATATSEAQAIQKEDIFEGKPSPKTSTATETFTTKESVNVQEIHEGHFESNLEIAKTVTSKPKVNIDTVESLIVEEVFSDNKPGKHLPEAFVPTEVASKHVIAQKELTLSEIVAPELEGDFTPGRLPPMQNAGYKLTTAEGINVEQITAECKEIEFKESVPDATNASEEIILSEGVSVTVVDSQMPSNDVKSEEIGQQKVSVEYLPNSSIIATTTLINERETEYQPGQIDSKKADASITCLEVSEVTDVKSQDSESPLAPDKIPTMSKAETSVKEVLPLSVFETETADTSQQFTDYPKYTTQTAIPDVETQDAAAVIETHAAESESTYNELKPTSYNVDESISDVQRELEVTEANTMESESNLKDFEFPDSYKGKQVSSHTLPTSIVEEVVSESHTSVLEEHKPTSTYANLNQPLSDETIITHTIPNESLGVYKLSEDTPNQQANIVIPQSQSIAVTEIISDDKEKECIPEQPFKSHQATTDITGQQVASKAEITLNFLPDDLKEEKPLTSQAKSEQTLIESVQVTQFQAGEREGEHTSDIIPDKKQALYDISESNTGLNVIQITSHEKEEEYIHKEIPKGVLASESVTTQEVAIKSENELVVHADEITPEEPLTGRAKKYARPLQELIVSEANVTDFHKDLPKDIFPYEKKANVNILPGQPLTVTETVSQDKEALLEQYNSPEHKQAHPAVSERETAIQEQIESALASREFSRISPEKDYARPTQDLSHHILQVHHTTGEKETELGLHVKPDSKQVNIVFEEGKSVTITETQTTDKEGSIMEPAATITAQGLPTIDSHAVAIKSEILPDDSTQVIAEHDAQKSEAKINQSVFESLTQSELNIQEKEGSFKEILPESKSAIASLQLGESVLVESVVTADKEKGFADLEQPQSSIATTNVIPQNTKQTTEVYAADALDNIENVILPKSFTAIPAHTEVEGIVQSQVITNEKESLLKSDAKLDEKTASLSLQDVPSAPTVLQTMTQDKEEPLNELSQPARKEAELSLDVQPVAETTIVNSEIDTTEIIIQKPNAATANVEQTTIEGIIQTDSVPSESESPLKKFEADEKIVNVDFEEGQSINVTEIHSIEKETDYTEFKAKDQTATTSVEAHPVVQTQEINITDNINKFDVKQPQLASAEPQVSTYTTATKSEELLHETEEYFSEKLKTVPKTASLGVNERTGLVVETISAEIRETDMPDLEMPDTKQVNTDMIDLKKVATKLEVLSDISLNHFDRKIENTVTANITSTPHESINQLQLVLGESEIELLETLRPDSQMVSCDIEQNQSVVISQVTLADTDGEYAASMLPTEKSATIGVDITHQVAQKSTTTTSEATEFLETSSPKETKASETKDIYSSIIVSENIVQESEKTFTDEFTPNVFNAEASFEREKIVQNITLVTTEDKEDELKINDKPDSKTANTSINVHEVANKTEVMCNDNVGSLTANVPNPSEITVKQEQFESIILTQPYINDSESDMQTLFKMESKIAEIRFKETSAITVSEAAISEQEKVLSLPQPIIPIQAEEDVIEMEARQTSQILTATCLEEFQPELIPEVSANLHQQYLEGLTNIETMAINTEEPLKTHVIPDAKNAEITVKPMSSISVTEVQTGNGHADLNATATIADNAKTKQDIINPVEEVQVMVNESVCEVAPFTTIPLSPKIEQDTLQSITQMQNTVHEKEKPYEYIKPVETKLKDATVIQAEAINVEEVIPDEKELTFKESQQSQPKQQAQANIPTQEHFMQSEILSVINVEKLNYQQFPEETAKLTQTSFEGITVMENRPQEQENAFNTKSVEEQTANLTLLPKKYIEISEIFTKDKEENIDQITFSSSTADTSVLPYAATNTFETIINENIKQMQVETEQPVSAQSETIPFENINITSLTLAEKETLLKPDNKPKLETASPTIDIPGKAATINDVTIDYKESYVPEDRYTVDKASIAIIEQNQVLQSAANVLHSTNLVPQTEERPSRKAICKQSTFENLTQTEVTPNDQTTVITTKYETSETATVNITASEGITITEINAEEQESEKVITGVAQEKLAETDIHQHRVAVKEENLPLNATGTFKPKEIISTLANKIAPVQQHGIIVSEKRSTGELDAILPTATPQTRIGKVVLEDTTSSLLISEVQLQDREGKYFNSIKVQRMFINNVCYNLGIYTNTYIYTIPAYT